MPNIPTDDFVDSGTWDAPPSSSGSTGGGGSSFAMSGSSATSISGAIGDFGTAIGDFMSIGSDNASAASYDRAAAIAGENVGITEASTLVQGYQQTRELQKTLGAQGASVAANGFTNSGSALDIARASAEQGALAHSLIVSQGQITENAYRQQQNSDLSMAAAERAKAQGAMIGGITSTLQGVASIATMAAA
jgi:hypothetical protein